MLGKLGLATLTAALAFAQDRARNLQAFPREEIANARKLALICAVDEYDEGAALRRLDYAEKDAADLCERLQAGGFTVRLLQKVTTRKKLLSETEKLVADAGDHDTLLFFFSGHGFGRVDAAGNPVNYILPASADPADLESTAVAIDEVATRMKSGKAKRCIILVDACRNDPYTRGPNASFFELAPGETGVGYLFATRPGSVSFEPEPGLRDPNGVEVKNGVFSHFLLSGLAGAAESNDDGVISFTELSDHVGASLQRLADAHRKAAKYDQVPYSRYDGPAGSDIPILVAPKPTATANDRARDPGQGSDNPAAVAAPALAKSSPDTRSTIESGSRVNLVLEFDQDVASVSVGRLRLALDSSRRIATGTFDVPTGVASHELTWQVLGVNRLEAHGTLTWAVSTSRISPFEALSRERNWSGNVVLRGKPLCGMTVTFEARKDRISTSPLSFDRSTGKFQMVGEFNGSALEFRIRGNSKYFLELLGVKESIIGAPAQLSDDGRTITGKLTVDSNVIGEYTLRAR